MVSETYADLIGKYTTNWLIDKFTTKQYKTHMKTKFCIIFAFLYIFCTNVFAQSTATEFETLLATDAVTYAQASRFVLEASDVLVTSDPEEAFLYAITREWLPKYAEPDDTALLGGVSLLLMRSFNVEGGFMYNVSKNTHSAMRELMYRNIIQGSADTFTIVSGEQLVFYVGRLLNEREREEALIARRAEERASGERSVKERLHVESFDFGLLLNQYTSYTKSTDETNDFEYFEYRGGIVPRVSFLLGDMGHFIASMGFTFGYNDELYYVPELLRTEFFIRFGALGITVGRMNYSDSPGFIVNSLLDGLQLTHSSHRGKFGLGAWYTGALYKKNARIIMTEYEQQHYDTPLVTDDFANTYFAPSRFIASFDWEHPSIGDLIQLNTALTGQIDLSRREEKYHSEYLSLKAGIPFNSFLFEAGGSLEAFQSKLAEQSLAFKMALAGEFGIHYTLASSFSSRLSFTGHYASGNGTKFGVLSRILSNSSSSSSRRNRGNPFGAFIPVTAKRYGEIFQAKMAGLTVMNLGYSARFIDSFGTSINASYFMRNDLETQGSYLITGNTEKDNKLLGAEIFTHFLWSPLSDLQFNLGAGVFIPSLGNYWPDAKAVWRIDLSLVFAVF